MLCSLLYRCSPEELRLLLIDARNIEYRGYHGVPHLLRPVVSDPREAADVLGETVTEMLRRYQLFQEAGVRHIKGYNDKAETKLPRIVVVIDDLTELMMTCKRDTEEHICRLAQLAKAAGIHLIIATQAASMDVLTGMIRANIPSRIAFRVPASEQSRMILDRTGAESLLGYGDMLYMPTGALAPIRVQGCFLADRETERVTRFLGAEEQKEEAPYLLSMEEMRLNLESLWKDEEELKERGANFSMTHVDFMVGSADMTITGITHEGEEVPVFINGNFAF
jgi:S-DNA-T family DNA segregation ATPase FtsK/SpoIIIE